MLRVGVLLQWQQSNISVRKPCRQIGIGLQTHDVHVRQGLKSSNARVGIGLAHGAHKHPRPIRPLTGQSRQHGQIELVRVDRSDKHQTRLGDASKRIGCWRSIQGSPEMSLIGDIAVVVGAGIQSHQRRLKIRRRGEHHIDRATQLPLAVGNQRGRHAWLGMNAVNTVINSGREHRRLR